MKLLQKVGAHISLIKYVLCNVAALVVNKNNGKQDRIWYPHKTNEQTTYQDNKRQKREHIPFMGFERMALWLCYYGQC